MRDEDDYEARLDAELGGNRASAPEAKSRRRSPLPDDRLRRRLLPGSILLEDDTGWSPIVPDNIAPPPEVNADGSSTCERCTKRLPLSALDITPNGYRCAECASVDQQLSSPMPTSLKVGRGRWWPLPVAAAVVGTITILAPALVFVTTGLVALLLFVWFMRYGFHR